MYKIHLQQMLLQYFLIGECGMSHQYFKKNNIKLKSIYLSIAFLA